MRSIIIISLFYFLRLTAYCQKESSVNGIIEIMRVNDTVKIVTTDEFTYFPFGKFSNKKQLKENLNHFDFIQERSDILNLRFKDSKIKLFFDSEERFYQIVSGTLTNRELELNNGIHIGESVKNVIEKLSGDYSIDVSGINVIQLEAGLTGICHYYEFSDGVLTKIVFVTDYQFSKYSGAGKTQTEVNNQDSSRVVYEANFVFQYGGESKLTLLPKVNLLRKHNLKLFNPYYGFEFGVHPLLIAGSFSFSGICGLEKSFISLETSVSHYRTTKVSDGEDGYKGPFSQNLLNTKLGIQIKGVKLKIGASFLLNENIPQGQERIPLLDIGKINGTIYGIELQFKIQ